jgi:eukaryotic-like serine/threonine-protein kinase
VRRLLVLVAALITFSPLTAAAQDATPTAAEPGATVTASRTDTRYVVPFTADGLNPGLTVTATIEGVCDFGSSIANSRPDAWGCSTGGGVLDPCFENPFLAPDELGQLACFDTPFSTDVVLLTLTAPLSREKEGPSGPGVQATSTEATIARWDLPWALELANGDRCALMRGTLFILASQTVYYGCERGGMVLGEPNRTQPVWVVSYVPEGAPASELVDIVAAWT